MPKVVPDVLAIVPISGAIQDHRLILTLSGRTVLDWTLTALRSVPRVAKIVIAPQTNVSGEVRAVVQRHATGDPFRVIKARTGRLEAIADALVTAPDCKSVLIQDPDRPLLSAGQLAGMLADSVGAPVAIPAVPLKSTFKHVEDGVVLGTLSRDRLVRMQSPRIFDRQVLENLLAAARRQAPHIKDDEISFVRQARLAVRLLPGDYFNIPLSDRLDVEFVELAIDRHLLTALSG